MTKEGYELESKSVNDEEAVAFINSSNSKLKDSCPNLLTREDLMRIEQTEPIWKRIRVSLLILFSLIWLIMLTFTILSVYFSFKCPNKPDLPFYKAKVGYWVDPYAYRDSNGDGVGDLNGLVEKFSYIKDVINSGYLILDSLFEPDPYNPNKVSYIGTTRSLSDVDPILGDQSALQNFLKKSRREGIHVLASIDFNSILIDSSLLNANNNASSNLPLNAKGLISRLGESVTSKRQDSYSVYGSISNLVDLNLQDPGVVQVAKESVKRLLKMGFSGILLKDAAFYMEGLSSFTNPESVNNDSTKNRWFERYQSSLMYASKSLEFIKSIQETVDEMRAATGQEKVLIVDSGNTGWGLPLKLKDPSEMYLQFGNDSLADLIIGRHFVKNRGWKAVTYDLQAMKPSLKNYLSTTTKKFRSDSCLVTATSNDAPYASAYATAMSLLLPGPSIIYYGSELGFKSMPIQTTGIYPHPKQALASKDDTDDGIAAHTTMLWDDSGVGFSKNLDVQTAYKSYLKALSNSSNFTTVEYLVSMGHEKNEIFDLTISLIKLRNTQPSIQWGDDIIEIPKYNNEIGLEVFVRSGGYGQCPILTAVITSDFEQDGKMLDLDISGCAEAKVLFTYPLNEMLPVDEKVSSKVYLLKLHKDKNGQDATIYLFICKPQH